MIDLYKAVFLILIGGALFHSCSKPYCGDIIPSRHLILQPSGPEGKDAVLWYLQDQSTVLGPTNSTNYGNEQDLPAMEWAFFLKPSTKNGLVQFDLSSLKKDTQLKAAYLSLFHTENSNDQGHAALSGSNEGIIRRVVSDWDENTVTWDTQPAYSEINKVILHASDSINQDYINIDVTDIVRDMLKDSNASFGFMISMQTPSYYRKLIFASSDHPNDSLHPKLELIYK